MHILYRGLCVQHVINSNPGTLVASSNNVLFPKGPGVIFEAIIQTCFCISMCIVMNTHMYIYMLLFFFSLCVWLCFFKYMHTYTYFSTHIYIHICVHNKAFFVFAGVQNDAYIIFRLFVQNVINSNPGTVVALSNNELFPKGSGVIFEDTCQTCFCINTCIFVHAHIYVHAYTYA